MKKVARELGFDRVLYVNEKKASLVWQLQDEVLEEWGAAACEARAAKEAAKAAEDARKAAMTYPEKIELLNEAVAEDQDAAMIVLRRYFTIDEVRKVASLMGIHIETADKRDLIDAIRSGYKAWNEEHESFPKPEREAAQTSKAKELSAKELAQKKKFAKFLASQTPEQISRALELNETTNGLCELSDYLLEHDTVSELRELMEFFGIEVDEVYYEQCVKGKGWIKPEEYLAFEIEDLVYKISQVKNEYPEMFTYETMSAPSEAKREQRVKKAIERRTEYFSVKRALKALESVSGVLESTLSDVRRVLERLRGEYYEARRMYLELSTRQRRSVNTVCKTRQDEISVMNY